MTEHWGPDWSLPSSLEACCPFSLSGILMESSRERAGVGKSGGLTHQSGGLGGADP